MKKNLITRRSVFSILFNFRTGLAITWALAPFDSILKSSTDSLSNTMFHVFQYVQIILLISMSPKIRQDFITFYNF